METEEEVLQKILKLHKSLPPRPSNDDIEAAMTCMEANKIQAIQELVPGNHVSDQLFAFFLHIQKQSVCFQNNEHNREAAKLIDIHNLHQTFDTFIRFLAQRLSGQGLSQPPPRNSNQIPELTPRNSKQNVQNGEGSRSRSFRNNMSRDDSFFNNRNLGGSASHFDDSTLNQSTAQGQDGEMLSMQMLARRIGELARSGVEELNFQGKLAEEVESIPNSIQELTSLITLNMSKNHILVLPDTIGGLSMLKCLDLHSNKIYMVQDAIGNLANLIDLYLNSNQLHVLPNSMGDLARLQVLDLSYNQLECIPYTISSLQELRVLNLDHNNLIDLPYTITECFRLEELHAKYNKLISLPNLIGGIGTLQLISVGYNKIKHLPQRLGSSISLKEVDVSFNELEFVPDCFCSSNTLVKLDISSNFACLKELPPSIGELVNLEELHMDHNQISILPKSFKNLSKLRVLNAQENPLTFPPQDVFTEGAEAVVQYISNYKGKSFLGDICCAKVSNKNPKLSSKKF